MTKVLNSISFDAPTSPVSANVNDTFTFSGTPGFSGSGGVQRYDFKWEVNPGSGYVTIAASGTGLTTSATNPIVNTNSTAQQSITVTCATAGSYTIRMSGAPTSGGSYTVLSSTQTVTVHLNANVNLTKVSATGSVNPLSVSVVQNTNINLTKVSATGSANALSVVSGLDVNLSSANGTGAVNSLASSVSANLGKVTSTGSANSLVSTISKLLGQVSSEGIAGTRNVYSLELVNGINYLLQTDGSSKLSLQSQPSALAPKVDKNISTVFATGSVNSLSLKIDTNANLTSVFGTGAYGAFTPTVSYTLGTTFGTGASASLLSSVDINLATALGTGTPGNLSVTTGGNANVNLTAVFGTGVANLISAHLPPNLLLVDSVSHLELVDGRSWLRIIGPAGNVSLIGVASTGAANSSSVTISKLLGQATATGTVNILTVSTSTNVIVNLASVQATGQVASLITNVNALLSSAAATGQAGALVSKIDVNLGKATAFGIAVPFIFAPPVGAAKEWLARDRRRGRR